MLYGYANLIDLIGQLPSDFKRVEESVLEMDRQILASRAAAHSAFLADCNPAESFDRRSS
jgi:hypothetical protein